MCYEESENRTEVLGIILRGPKDSLRSITDLINVTPDVFLVYVKHCPPGKKLLIKEGGDLID